MSRVLPNLSISGRSFFVLNNATTVPSWLGNVLNDYPPSSEGTVRMYSTIALAVAACTANRGDVIYVLPNHTENISSATALNISIAGVRIQGMGEGGNRPYLTLNTATTATVTISASNVTIDNCIIDGTGFAAVASIFTISTTLSDITLSNCTVITANATNQAGLALTATAFTRLSILNCQFLGTANAGTTNALQLVGGTGLFVRNNVFIGNYTTSLGAINNITTAITELVIDGNILVNNTASSTKVIVLVSGSTGVISNNRVGILSSTAPFTSAGAYWLGNYYAASAGSVGVLN
jgi:hypothetical protein